MTDPFLLVRLLVLLGLANGMPVFATRLLKDRLARRLDGELVLRDGRPLFGASKTIRGLFASIGSTTLVAPLVGLDWTVGATLAAASMAGDLVSSFLKRRLGFEVHAQAFGLDQIPEALLPLLLLRQRLELTAADVAVVVAAFILLEIGLPHLLHRLRIREQPC